MSLEGIDELRARLDKSTGFYHALLIIESFIDESLKKGLSAKEIRDILDRAGTAKYVARLSSCRATLLVRLIKKDPRLKHLQENADYLLELLQRECGSQTLGEEPTQQTRVPAPAVEERKREEKIIGEKYMIVRLIGEGGMGLVWLGLDKERKTEVAIKEPKITGNPLSDDVNIRKIRIEAEILQNLDHKNIVRYIDYFIENSKPYLVMEYIEATPLETAVNPLKTLEQEEALQIFTKIVDAVDYMHSKNVVHRDLKPKNIFVKSEDRDYVKVIDFGTAKFYHSQLETGEAIYSPGGYTAPEQLKFMYSPQSDIWSLGGLLFYILTGKPPITVMPGYPNLKSPPEVERLLGRDVDQNVVKAIKRALNPNPLERYLRASDLILEIRGRKTTVEAMKRPKIIVLNKEIDIETRRVVIGRYSSEDVKTGEKIEEAVMTMKEGENLYIYVKDPKSYVSRLHIEIFQINNKWYMRDLGSLNKSAVMKGDSWETVHTGYRVPSKPVELGNKAMISLGYDEKLGPYIVLSFIAPTENE